MALPSPANYLGLWYILQDSDATGAVPSNQIILRKKAGDNTLYLETDAGEEKISTGGGGGIGDFTQVTITGDNVAALLVQNAAETKQVMQVDTIGESVDIAGTLNVQGDITLTGTLSTVMSNVLQFDDSLINIAANQTTTDTYDQGWYAEYSPNGTDVWYRGIAYDHQAQQFKCFTDEATEPDGTAGFAATGSFAAATGAFEASSNQIVFGTAGESITLNAAVPGGTDYTYTIPDVGGNAEFLMSAGTNVITGQWTFTDLHLADSTDQTKQLVFNLTNISTATTRTMTMPNYASFPAGTIGTNNLVAGRMGYSSITTGSDNILLSSDAGAVLTTSSRNTAIGQSAFAAATSSSNDNVVIGYNAATSLTANSILNVAIGSGAFSGATSGNSSNIAIGANALDGNFSGRSNNIAIGTNALGAAAYAASNNIAIGTDAGLSLTTGIRNIGIGSFVMDSLTTSSDNVAIGEAAFSTAADSSNRNVAIGVNAMTGAVATSDTIAIGYNTLRSTALNGQSGIIAIGAAAMSSVNYNASNNIGIGQNTCLALTVGTNNTCLGNESFRTATDSDNNVAVGLLAGAGLASQSHRNTIVGRSAMAGAGSNCVDNVAIGYAAMDSSALSGQSGNIAIGTDAIGLSTYNASNNVVIGNAAGNALTTGGSNTIVGHNAGQTLATGTNNIILGNQANVGASSDSDWIVIGNDTLRTGSVAAPTAWTQTANLRIRIGNNTYYLPLSTVA